jgi:hypothetical protein
LVEPISPELALVDPELAERARAQLVDGHEPARRSVPVRQIEQAPRRRRSRFSALVVVIALAAGLGGAAALWIRYDDHSSSSREAEQPTTPPQRRQQPSTPTSERGETTTARAARQVVAGVRHVMRPTAFHITGAPKEPLGEISLPARAQRLSAWLTPSRGPTAPNQRHWLYQHAWIVTGSKFGWWHGAAALRVLIRVDRRIESQWGIGHRSETVARNALAAVEARTE